MRRVTIAILWVCGLMASMVSAQNLSETSSSDVPEVSTQGDADKGAGLRYGPLRIAPELIVSYFHDTNPTYMEHDAKAVDGIRAQPMLDLILTGNDWGAYTRGWLSKDWYIGSIDPVFKDTLEQEHYGESAGFNMETLLGTRVAITETYDYENYSTFVPGVSPGGVYNASWQDRYSLTLGASVDTRLGEKTGMSVGASYSDLWYANPLLYGWQDAGGTLGFSRKLTEKSDLVLDFGADNQWSDGSSGESRSYRMLVGFGSQPTAKSTYRAEVGIMGYDFNNGADTVYAPTYNLSGNWRVSQRMSVNFSGSANYQPSETDQNNYTLVDSISAGLNFEATSRLTTSLNVIYRREDYAKTDAGVDDKRLDNQIDLYGRASYRVFRYTSFFVGADFSKNTSTIGEWAYNRLYLETGMDVRF